MAPGWAELFKAGYIFAFSIAIWASLLFLRNRSGNKSASSYLLLLIWVIFPVLAAVYIDLVTPNFKRLAFSAEYLAERLTWLYGPIVLHLIDAALNPTSELRRPSWQFLCFPLAVLASILCWLFEYDTNLINYIAIVHADLYFIAALHLLMRNRQRLAMQYSGGKQVSYRQLQVLIVGGFLLNTLDFALYADGATSDRFSWHLLCLGVAVYVVFASALLWDLCASTTRCGSPVVLAWAGNLSVPSQGNQRQRELRELELSTAQTLARELDRLMKEEKLYLSHELTLSGLAEAIGVTSHQMSDLLNGYMKVSYHDYVHRFRIEEAKTLLEKEGSALHISDIAYQAGFNDKNTFNKAFRKHFHCTPSEFRARGKATRLLRSTVGVAGPSATV